MTINPLAQQRDHSFQQRIAGTWGQFMTPRGAVSYLMTNARLGTEDTPDEELRLARALRPVREVLNTDSMTFSQLLQRDLDDYRVATELVPYILREDAETPAFFPPILAVLLPFAGPRESAQFPPQEPPQDIDDGGLPLRQTAYGNAFAERRLLEGDSLSPINYGQLLWNEEQARVVVLDGQHRAMALLAIQRTVWNSWDDSARGARYRHFYERRVRALLETSSISLSQIRFPVTVCWFPEDSAESNRSARQLFVDVNREARPPSQDRVVLLNDANLLDIFTRDFLDHLRAADSRPPLHAIEYDRSRTAGIHSKWSSISSLQAVKHIVDHLVFGPEKYIETVDTPIRGSRGAPEAADENMRRRLLVEDVFPSQIDGPDGSFEREELGVEAFPAEVRGRLVQAYMESWGASVRTLLGETLPYRVHYDALERIRREWEETDRGGADSLAREAIFSGGNLYWTLRRSAMDWRDDPTAKDIRQAWRQVEAQGQAFRAARAELLLGGRSEDQIVLSEDAYSVYATIACQLGLALTFATLANRAGISGLGLNRLAQTMVGALNLGLESKTPSGLPRLLAVSQKVDRPLNRISDMNTPRGIEFRYFWLELLSLPDASAFLASQTEIAPETVDYLKREARGHYFSYVVDDAVKRAIRYVNEEERPSVQVVTAGRTYNDLKSSLEYWFDIAGEEVDHSWRGTDLLLGAEDSSLGEDDDPGIEILGDPDGMEDES
jgi:hypothetical protein